MQRKHKAAKPYRPTGWQLDPSRLTTSTVQYWSNGVMLTAQLSLEDARRLVRGGMAFVICNQAVGALIDGVARS